MILKFNYAQIVLQYHDLAKVIINHITSSMHISKYVRITEFGAIESAFTIAASLVINDAPCNNILIVTDGDKYITDDQKRNQLNLKLSGTESDHNNKIEKALSLITQFTLPENTAPEKYLHDLLIELDNENEITEIAKTITNPKDSHGWINDILKSIEVDENITLSKIIDTISTHRDYSIYIEKIKNWLAPKKRELNLTVQRSISRLDSMLADASFIKNHIVSKQMLITKIVYNELFSSGLSVAPF